MTSASEFDIHLLEFESLVNQVRLLEIKVNQALWQEQYTEKDELKAYLLQQTLQSNSIAASVLSTALELGEKSK